MAAGRCHPSRYSRPAVYRVDRDGDRVYERAICHEPNDFHSSFVRLRDDKNHRKQKDWDIDKFMDNYDSRFRYRETEMTLAKDGRDEERERYRYIRYRENDGGRSSNQSDSGNSNGKRHDSNAEKEPGELSSDSESDHDLDSHVVEGEVQKPDDINSPSKRRKYSPMSWDLRGQACKVLLAEAESDAEEDLNSRIARHSDALPYCPVSVDEREAAAELPLSSNFDGEEETLPPRNIAASRWADSDDLEEDASFLDNEEKRKKASSSVDSKSERFSSEPSGSKIISPESGEYIRERLDGSRPTSRSLDTDLGQDSGGICRKEFEHNNIRGVEYSDGDLNQRELLELNKEDNFKDDSHEQLPESRSCEDSHTGTPMSLVPSPLPSHRTVDMLQGCRSVDEFERLNKINEGTYGIVYRARNKKSGEILALKKVKMENEREGFPMTSLREINTLLSFHHPSIVDVKEVVVGSNLDSIFMVMEYMEHDLKGFMESMKQPFSQSEVKCLMLQLLEGVNYLHNNWVLHRDLKTSNLLFNNRGELKICDFGLARQYGSPLKTYTRTVVTLWYRAPELLLGSKHYSTAVDIWSLGCVMAELLSKEPLFNGKSEIDQLDKIFRTLGTPNEKIWPDFVNLPGVKCNFLKQPYNKLRDKFPATSFSGRPTLSESGFDLLNRLLTYDPHKRITADEALKHEWFREVPLPKSREFMPTCPAQNDHDRQSRRHLKSPHPLEEHRRKELQQGDLGAGSLFG